MNNISTYLDLCSQFYDLDKPLAPSDEYKFFRSYAQEAKGKILEPMMGNGRFLIPLKEEGFDIEGFDASEHMINIAKKKCHDKNLEINIWFDFIENFKSNNRYDLIFIPSGSFGLILDNEKIYFSIKNLYDHLNPGGQLVFDVESARSVVPGNEQWISKIKFINDKKFIIGSFLPLGIKDSVSTTICKYELVENGEITKTQIENFKLKLQESSDVIKILEEVGFHKILTKSSYNREEQASSDDSIVTIECLK